MSEVEVDTLPNHTPLSTTPNPESNRHQLESERCRRLQADLDYANGRLLRCQVDSQCRERVEGFKENLREDFADLRGDLAKIEGYATDTLKTSSEEFARSTKELLDRIDELQAENSKHKLRIIELERLNEQLDVEIIGFERQNIRYAEYIEGQKGVIGIYERNPAQFVNGAQGDVTLPQYNDNPMQTYEPPAQNQNSFIINPGGSYPNDNFDYGMDSAESNGTYNVAGTQVTENKVVPVHPLLAPKFPTSDERNTPWPLADGKDGSKDTQESGVPNSNKKRKSK